MYYPKFDYSYDSLIILIIEWVVAIKQAIVRRYR